MKLSLFTVSFAGFWGQHRLSLEDAIVKTAELGFTGVEIMGKRPHMSPLDYSVDDCKRLRDLMEQHKLTLSAMAAYTNFTGGMGSSPEVPFADMQVQYIDELAKRTQVLGGDLIRIFTSYERDDVPFTKQWRQTIDAIRACCDQAADYDIRIGVQNHHDIGVDTKTFQELLHQVNRNNVLPMFDCWSSDLRGEDLLQSTRTLAPQMQFTTVADYIVLPRARYRPDAVNYEPASPAFAIATPMGKGELHYKTFFDALAQENFNGWVSYEMCSPLRDGGDLSTLEHYCRTFVDYMTPWVSPQPAISYV